MEGESLHPKNGLEEPHLLPLPHLIDIRVWVQMAGSTARVRILINRTNGLKVVVYPDIFLKNINFALSISRYDVCKINCETILRFYLVSCPETGTEGFDVTATPTVCYRGWGGIGQVRFCPFFLLILNVVTMNHPKNHFGEVEPTSFMGLGWVK